MSYRTEHRVLLSQADGVMHETIIEYIKMDMRRVRDTSTKYVLTVPAAQVHLIEHGGSIKLLEYAISIGLDMDINVEHDTCSEIGQGLRHHH